MPLHIEKIKQIPAEEKKTKAILITDHVYKHVMEISDNLYVLSHGKTHLTRSLRDIEALGYASV
jgi:ABC-type lipopolysaccharide export system ATPase subunit